MNLEPMQKAAVLIEALPYIQRFNRKIVVVKYGGSAIGAESVHATTLQDVAALRMAGVRVVLVHGGGKHITALLSRLHVPTRFENGYRIYRLYRCTSLLSRPIGGGCQSSLYLVYS